MRRHGIRAIMARPRRVRTTDSRHDFPIAPNLLDRNFTRRRAEPDLARRHHLRRDRSGLALSGRRHGPLQPQDRRLGDGGSFARRTAIGGLAMAIATQRPGAGLIHHSDRGVQYASDGYRNADPVRWLPGLDEPQGRLLSTMLRWRASSTRSKPSSSITGIMQHGSRSQRDIFALHRRLLQPNASPLGHRLYQPDRDGTKSSLTLSIFSGEDRWR